MRIKIESDAIEKRMSKKQVPYFKQTAWVPLVDRDGVVDPYPTKITFMVSKDQHGNPMPYPVGEYELHPSSFRVGNFGDLEIGFVNLVPIRKQVPQTQTK